MSSHLDKGYAERSRIERGIREYDFSLKRISEERVRLAARLAECNLIRRLLLARQLAPRIGVRNINRSCSRIRHQRSASH